MFCKITRNFNTDSSEWSWIITCGNPKCQFDFMQKDLWFCSFICQSCKKKNLNLAHASYHTSNRSNGKCFFSQKHFEEYKLKEA